MIQKSPKLVKIIHDILLSMQPDLRPDFFVIVTFIIEEYISKARMPYHFKDNVSKIKMHINSKLGILASSLTQLLPGVPKPKKELAGELFRDLVIDCVQPLLSIWEGFFEVEPE